MFLARIISLKLLKQQQHCIESHSRCFLSNLSFSLPNNTINQKRLISTTKDENDSNEWLWAYLRDRKSFSDLNEEQRRRVIEIEIQTLREAGDRVPDEIPEERWNELLNLPTVESRKTVYGYLFLRELHRKRRAAVVASNDIRRAESSKRRATLLAEGKQPTNYPGYSTIFRHLGRQNEKYMREQLLLAPARLGEMLVIDCGFEKDHVREYYLSSLADQLQYLFADISQYHSPSFIYLCNVLPHGRLQAEFDRRASLENMCFEKTSSSYLDLFPPEKLIYLSPDSNNEMTSFDHDAVYIVGGIADRSKSFGL
ncbi:hypothetical protein I4U23_002593 [Adineta vaga]|nr:hypothetical protein I4U23_002593 [Adineta vaga]